MPTTLAALLSGVSDPARPLLTLDDRATGERVELSAVTTANWVAKTANLLVDELDAEPGTRVRLGLPSHWLRHVWLLSAWTVGATVVDADADIGVSGPELQAQEQHRVAASLRPLGARFSEPPPGFLDLGVEVPGQGDDFVALDPPTPDTAAMDVDGLRGTHADLLAGATPTAERVLVEPGSVAHDARLLVDLLLGGGSLVLVRSGTPAILEQVAVQERALIR
ncbi:TIGR03089 family protein [Aeromicrobium sp. CF4.19]|uniref:TIGR03089 family protein n=1 Tax=Aeromicrobium sp. CF4.19 TaxID=3373082 RepID=UPI003EE49164